MNDACTVSALRPVEQETNDHGLMHLSYSPSPELREVIAALIIQKVSNSDEWNYCMQELFKHLSDIRLYGAYHLWISTQKHSVIQEMLLLSNEDEEYYDLLENFDSSLRGDCEDFQTSERSEVDGFITGYSKEYGTNNELRYWCLRMMKCLYDQGLENTRLFIALKKMHPHVTKGSIAGAVE